MQSKFDFFFFKSSIKSILAIIGFCLVWFAVIMQFILIIENRQAGIAETIIRFFSFFTILTNILVALFFTFNIFFPSSKISLIFTKIETFTALTTFILVVGLVYQFILRWLWQPGGMQMLVDELLHSIIPFYFLIYWFIFASKEKVNFRATVIWLFYPLLYLAFVLIRGSISGFFPYPFLNFLEIGIARVSLNCLIIVILILVVLKILIGIKNWSIDKRSQL